MMHPLLDQVRFTLCLELESDLHVGTGESIPLSEFTGHKAAQDESDPLVAAIARDLPGRPIVPATALKSGLRRAIADEAEAARLLGKASLTDWIRTARGEIAIDKGQSGTIWLGTATLHKPPVAASGLPHWNESRQTYLSTHVALARRTRTADEHKLFWVERVPQGASFTLDGIALGSEARADLDTVLALLRRGIAVGAGERKGAGRLVLDKVMSCVCHHFDAAAGSVRSAPLNVLLPPAAAARSAQLWSLRLECEGPYVSIDASRRGANDMTRCALRRDDQTPLLNPDSLLGALRARTAFLSHAHASRLGLEEKTDRGDDPFARPVEASAIAGLTCTQRLFGVGGWRGLVRILSLNCEAGVLCDGIDGRDLAYTSLAIDRFSGAPLDGALYQTEYFLGARFAVRLTLDSRGEWPSAKDRALFGTLLADIADNGVMLGHGTNRGFGWFTVSIDGAVPVADPDGLVVSRKQAPPATASTMSTASRVASQSAPVRQRAEIDFKTRKAVAPGGGKPAKPPEQKGKSK